MKLQIRYYNSENEEYKWIKDLNQLPETFSPSNKTSDSTHDSLAIDINNINVKTTEDNGAIKENNTKEKQA